MAIKMPDLGKQVGPLPLGAWIVVVGGGLGVAYYTRNFGKTETPVEVEDTSGVPGVGTGGSGQWIDLDPPAQEPQGPTIITNDDWGRAAVNYLISKGFDAAVSDQAIRKYLAAEQLNIQERTLINAALIELGAPPVPLPPGPGLPTIPQPQEPPDDEEPKPQPKPTIRYYTVKRGDNLWNIAKRYYRNGLKWTTIYNANRKGKRRADGTTGMISNPNLIQPGWKLIIP